LRFPVYSLRTGILAQLVFLIVAAMLLINVVMVRLAERDLIRAKLDAGRLLVRAIEQNLGYFLFKRAGKLSRIDSDMAFQQGIARLLTHGGFSDVVIINGDGEKVFTTGPPREEEGNALSLARESLATGLGSHHFSGSTWGVIWLSQKELFIASPLKFDGSPFGGITVSGSLIPVYETLRHSQKIILLYILLDTLILVVVGIVLLSRIVVKPIHKLLKLTGEYKEGYMVPSIGEASKNEIGELSRSLKNMLKRLDENKRELKAHIASLEKANQELKQAQDEIIRSEKLASVGRLAAGIAHEIGNPIGIVLGYLDLLQSDDVKKEEKTDYLRRIESEISRINQIIRQLLDFSRPSSGKSEETPVHKMIMKTVDMFKPQPMMEDIEINLDLKASKDTVLADPNELQQVLLNIIMNAADALSEIGPPGSEKRLVIGTENSGGSIKLLLSDNGPGIPEDELAQIFDPFFTTKDPGKGTGLGLSVCYRIVEGLGGTIRAESVEGEGMTLAITLPLMDEGEKRNSQVDLKNSGRDSG
jgi:two-component system NtrC family sensor kinase